VKGQGKILLDTDVVSYFLKGDTRTKQYEQHLIGKLPAISFQNLAELFAWPKRRMWAAKRTQGFLSQLKHYDVLPYDTRVCWWWSEVMYIRGARWRQPTPGSRPRLSPTTYRWLRTTSQTLTIFLASNSFPKQHHKSIYLSITSDISASTGSQYLRRTDRLRRPDIGKLVPSGSAGLTDGELVAGDFRDFQRIVAARDQNV